MGAILKKEKCYSLHGFPDKVTNISKPEKVEPKFFIKNIKYLSLKSKCESMLLKREDEHKLRIRIQTKQEGE